MGICLIVNNKNFSVSLRRDGADVDEKLLKGLFQDLDFTVEVKHDLTRDEIKGTAEEFAAKDHSQFDAFVFFILSHGGDHDTILGCDEGAVGVRELMRMFTATKCPSLEAKPKLFFIQACRGRSYSLPRTVCPQEADFLLAFATTPGHAAYRDTPATGSFFMNVSFAM